ncbi:MAG: FGGY family carbohydrate kinase [Clostridia bacterium]
MSKYMIGIDIGTQSIRVQMYDQDANCIAKYAMAQYMDTPQPAWATEKASVWWAATKDGIRAVVKESGVNAEEIVSIGCDAVMHSPVPITADGTIVEDHVQLYCDKRGAQIADAINASKEQRIAYDLTANVATSNWQGIKIRWIKDHQPEVYDQTYKFLTGKDYINFMLTGEACIDFSEGTGTYCMDRKRLDWSDEMLCIVGIDREKLPRPCKAYDVIGRLRKPIADELGLSTKTVVVCGAGDMMASLFVSGLAAKGSVSDCTGTGSVLCYYSDEPILDPRIMNLRHALDGWVAFGCVDSSGGAFRWLRDTIAKQESAYAREQGLDEYAYLSELAKDTPAGADGLLFFPYLMGERTMGSADSRGSFIGLNVGTGIGHMVRSVLEGIAFEHKRTLDLFEGSGKHINSVYHTGGAAKGALWNQIKADIYQKPVYTLRFDEGGVLGSALLGGVGAGLFPNPETAAKMVLIVKDEYLPDVTKAHQYSELFHAFCETHDALQKPFFALAHAATVK